MTDWEHNIDPALLHNADNSAAHEIDQIPFSELARPFASGRIRMVDQQLNFEQVVQAMLDNDQAQVSQWIENALIRIPNDELAKTWIDQSQIVTAAVVAPWVVIQEP